MTALFNTFTQHREVLVLKAELGGICLGEPKNIGQHAFLLIQSF